MDEIFTSFDASTLSLAVAVAMLAAYGIGLLIGRRWRERHRRSLESKFDDASVALLGLLLAFAFGASIVKHDNRRLMVVADSNSIGDFYVCASLLKEPVRTQLRNLIRDYAELRLEAALQLSPKGSLEGVLRQSEQMQAQMTNLVARALNGGTPIAVPLTNSLNNLTSSHSARLAAVRDRLPGSIFLLLFATAILATMLVGREQGASEITEAAGTLCFIVIVAFAVYVTLDLNQPTRGLIKVSQEPIQRLLSSMPN